VVQRLITALGVDYRQWRALLRAYMMLDFAALRGVYGPETARIAAYGMIMMCVLFGLMGLTPALLIWYSSDVLFAATVMVTVIAGIAVSWAVIQIPTVISADDYAIVGYRPVSSRTYLAVRTSALMIHTGQVVLLSGYLPMAAFLTRSNGSWRMALGAAAALVATAIAATFGVVATYGGLLRVLGASRMRRVTAYLTVLIPLAFMGGSASLWFFFVDFGDFGLKFSVKDVALPRTTATLMYPGTWFGAYVDIASGRAGGFELLAASHSIVLLIALTVALRSWVSSTYAVRIAQMTMDVTAPATRPDPAWSRLRGEWRAMALLMRHQFRDDMNAQVNVVMSIVLTLGLFWMVAYTDLPADPFAPDVEGAGSGSGFMLIYAAYSLPSTLWMFLVTSSSPQAAWPFFTTPSAHARLIMSARDVVAIVTLPITFILMTGFCTWAFGNLAHALLYSALIMVLAYLDLQIFVLARPRLPFSVSAMSRSGMSSPFGGGIGFLLVLTLMPVWLLVLVLSRTWIGVVLSLAGLIAISVVLNHFTRRRIVKLRETIVYGG
jgi:hypothetical protein